LFEGESISCFTKKEKKQDEQYISVRKKSQYLLIKKASEGLKANNFLQTTFILYPLSLLAFGRY